MKRWKHLRDAFAKSEKKAKETKRSGSQASKKRRYIFNDELQFLGKLYQERNTEESFNTEDGENKDEDDMNLEEQEDGAQSVTSVAESVATTVSKVATKEKPPRRQHKKMDEVDLKILKAIDNSEKEVKKDNKLSFFESLLPHVNKFDDNEWLQCQLEFLQVISKMKNRNLPPIPHHDLHNPSTSQFQVLAQPSNFTFPQQPYYGHMYHQSNSSNMHSQVSPTQAAQHVHQVQMTQVGLPKGAQPISLAATRQRSVPQASKPKSPATLHYESYSLLLDDDELSRASSCTIDFTEL